MEKGIIYVLTNIGMKGVVKIGATRNDVDKRMDSLFNGSTGVPAPFDCACACRVPLNRMFEIETALHNAFHKHRVYKGREFFWLEPSEVIPILEIISNFNMSDDATEVVQSQLDEALEGEERADVMRKRPNFDFYELGLHDGDILTYKDGSASCIIVDSKHVDYLENHAVSLSAVTRSICGYAAAPLPFWNAPDGTSLDVVRERVCASKYKERSDATIAHIDQIDKMEITKQ